VGLEVERLRRCDKDSGRGFRGEGVKQKAIHRIEKMAAEKQICDILRLENSGERKERRLSR